MGSSAADRSPRTEIDVLLSEYPFPDFLGPIRARAEEFEKAHPEYRVTIRGCYYEELPAQVSAEALAGKPPTIASYYSGASQQAMDTVTQDGRPLFAPIASLIGDRSEILGEPVILDDLIDACRDFYTIGGQVAAVPLTLSTMLLYSNKPMLRAAGIEAIPSTWDELTAACAALSRLDGGPEHAVTWPVDGKLFQQAVAQQGGLFLDNENGRLARATTVDLTSPEVMAYVEWWRALAERGEYVYTGKFEDWLGNATTFAEGRVAFRVDSSFAINFMAADDTDTAVSLLPYNGAKTPAGNWIGGDALWVADGLDPVTRDGALAFIQYLNNPRNAAEWHKASGSTPATKGAVAVLESEGWFDAHPVHRVATEQLERTTRAPGSSVPVFPGSHGIQTAIMAAMEDVLVRGADPLARFTRATAEAQKALDHYNATCLGDGPRDPEWLVVGT
ncbi:extracellular solute-binding protein [Actinokineospora sp. UTMC 2448]|uniref:extracellular solute-binding protein n=1 Tax=Actinokineospora sp. UTMC 2448 TaxID=2268449 RepID=UPI002164E2CE|nr:extracellular solute-binding protein [Actinokineospora sp. UTMC 2448]UVS81470.1 sn-glycerol-3-phosphate-binding periplasmic protein UgpB precursor [Actinokineospora sp. UTMC 2448]